MPDDNLKIVEVLSTAKSIAVVGASDDWKRPSFYVMKYLQKQGYRILPINPRLEGKSILGETVYSKITDVPYPIDIVDVFRPPRECIEIAENAIAIDASCLWMQIGIESEEAAIIAEAAGIKVIMNRCPKIEHSRLSGLLGNGGFVSGLLSARRQTVPKPPVPVRNGGYIESNSPETLAVHAGTRPDGATGARITPLYQTASFTFDDADHAASLYDLQEPGNVYGRLSNPTTAALEQKIAALEGALGACCVASGHAAQLVALYPFMAPGRKIVASKQLYGGSITQFTQTFKSFGWEAELVDIHDLEAVKKAILKPEVAVLFSESLSNPDGSITDIEALSKLAMSSQIPLFIDNTMATSVMCKPGVFGADVILYSTTKFMSGHGNALGGAVVDMGSFDWMNARHSSLLSDANPAYHGIRFAETFGKLSYITFCHASVLRDLGPTMAPMNAFLTLTGMETLPLRMRQHNENAAKVAHFLRGHPAVADVSWAGFSDSPYYDRAKKYLAFGAGSVFTFAVKDGYYAGQKLVENCNLLSHLANIGDTRSLIIHPASTIHRQLTDTQREQAGIGAGTIRVSIGIENPNDIIADLEGALAVVSGKKI
ncbi:aminotransferase class I/II-fold pyridoxal phosphate-dependent enzyme [Candidatus Puniceispirillum sp.]|nr:aminotransferase class I/II-fold pyridoxal phosphate-dependent enzyme [Candidatus Puniceispirillum sp.]